MISSTVVSVLAVLSLTSVINAATIHSPRGGAIQRRANKITTCRGTGEYPIPQNNQCKPCSFKFPGASTCSATAALRCRTADNRDRSFFLSISGVTTCPASTFNGNGECLACSSKFPGAATCTSSAATKWSVLWAALTTKHHSKLTSGLLLHFHSNTGYLSSGKCASVCPTGFVNAPSTRTCVACNRFDNLALTCSAGKIATCAAGAYLNSAQNDCIACTSVNRFATTCSSASVITACSAPYSVSADKNNCVLGSGWSYYLASSIPDVPYTSNVQTPVICGRRAVSEGSQVAVFDSNSLTCFSTSASTSTELSELVWDTDSAVMVLGSCKTNNAIMPAAKSRCRDVTLTASSCTLTADRSACSGLFRTCSGSQFRNFDGVCQECATAYQDALTCDIFSGATTCIDGDYLNNGTCTSCSTFDPNAASCAANGTLSACNNGWVLSNNSCTVDTSATASVLDNSWSYYPDSLISSLTVLNNNSIDQYDCVEAVYAANFTLAAFDPTSNNCYVTNASTNITESITDVSGASVFVIDTCAANEANESDPILLAPLHPVPSDQGNACYDVTIDEQSCQVNGQPCS
ncbi:BQ5605_C013g07358 [Microbotryum silenes-dioicae]|uniref:BQ5605_C013g07358 protein n=1 Tax=Microbotryum silenes-dioicae TaxID=796604 RepID=A0A2X0NVV4_9BASI|nr:BQ5605_C013g07358 [Microbotryum silenes-dioicae]